MSPTSMKEQKRKREKNNQKNTLSPSQASPENKVSRSNDKSPSKESPRSPTSNDRSTDDMKKKARGRTTPNLEDRQKEKDTERQGSIGRSPKTREKEIGVTPEKIGPEVPSKKYIQNPSDHIQETPKSGKGVKESPGMKEVKRKDKDGTKKASEKLKKEKKKSKKKEKQILSSLRTSLSYSEAILKNPTPILPQFKAHRILVTFEIDQPDTKAKRTTSLSKQLNKFLKAAKSASYKNRTVYVRRFAEHQTPEDTEKNDWIKEFDGKQVSHLMHYTHGFYSNQALRGGVFRLMLQVMIPVQSDPGSFIENANEIFSTKEKKKVQDVDAQNLYDPETVGWLFRSNWNMTGSPELREEIEAHIAKRHPGLVIGLSFKTVTPPGDKQVYNRETAVGAIVVSCNADHYRSACDTLFQLYNSTVQCPLGIQMHFVPSKDHPDVKNNPAAHQNLSILIDRQRIFLKTTQSLPCHALASPDQEISKGVTL